MVGDLKPSLDSYSLGSHSASVAAKECLGVADSSAALIPVFFFLFAVANRNAIV